MINFAHGPRDSAGAVISAYRTVTLTVSYRVLQPQLLFWVLARVPNRGLQRSFGTATSWLGYPCEILC